jgi:site-specific recombinase XerD
MTDLPPMLDDYIQANDFSVNTIRAIRFDLRKFVHWFEADNQERFDPTRITVRDVVGFRDYFSRVHRQKVSTVNRALVTLRRFLGHLVTSGVIQSNPAETVKEMRRVCPTPRGLKPAEVRKVMREVELRQDHRAAAILGVMVYAGLRVAEVCGLEIADVEIGARAGRLTCRHGKGNKLRVVPLSIDARRALEGYLQVRPPAESQAVFIGERGPLTTDGVRAICKRYSALSGIKFTPHWLRHAFARQFLAQTGNDLPGLAQILGHENINTTAIYTRQSEDDLQGRIENLHFE